MRTDIRLFRLDKFHLPRAIVARASSPSLPPALLAHGVELGGRTVAVDSRATAESVSTLNRKWSQRGVLFGSLDELARTHGDLVRSQSVPRRESARRQIRRAARRLLVRRHAAVCAQGCGDRRTAAHAHCTIAGRSRFQPFACGTRRRGRSHAPLRNRRQRDGRRFRRGLALRRDRTHRWPWREVALREPAKLGHRRLALRPSKSTGRSRRRNCNGPSAPWAAGWQKSISTSRWPGRKPTCR